MNVAVPPPGWCQGGHSLPPTSTPSASSPGVRLAQQGMAGGAFSPPLPAVPAASTGPTPPKNPEFALKPQRSAGWRDPPPTSLRLRTDAGRDTGGRVAPASLLLGHEETSSSTVFNFSFLIFFFWCLKVLVRGDGVVASRRVSPTVEAGLRVPDPLGGALGDASLCKVQY